MPLSGLEGGDASRATSIPPQFIINNVTISVLPERIHADLHNETLSSCLFLYPWSVRFFWQKASFLGGLEGTQRTERLPQLNHNRERARQGNYQGCSPFCGQNYKDCGQCMESNAEKAALIPSNLKQGIKIAVNDEDASQGASVRRSNLSY